MLRSLTLAVSLFAFGGLAAAECSDSHGQKDAMATTDTVLASNVPAVQTTAMPAPSKQVPACENGSCDGVAKPAVNTKTAKKPVTPLAKGRMLVANQCESAPCK